MRTLRSWVFSRIRYIDCWDVFYNRSDESIIHVQRSRNGVSHAAGASDSHKSSSSPANGSSPARSSSPRSLPSSMDFPSSSIPSSSSLLSMTVHNQVLPEVRSPPKKNIGLDSSNSMDSVIANSRRGRRPRLFGFTEMPDGDGSSGSQASSASCSVSGSRSPSPTRASDIPSELAATTRFDTAPSRKASDALTFIPRRHAPKASRTQSENNLVTIPKNATNGGTPAASDRPASTLSNPSLPSSLRISSTISRPGLSTRTSAQRNESALKLDLQGLKSSQGLSTTGTSLSPSALIRKKSGEILKPSLKTSSSFASLEGNPFSPSGSKSCPSTPSSFPKYVHFDTQLERVKLFLHDQKPQVVSRDGSPADYTTSEGEEFPFPPTDEEADSRKPLLEIRLPNFPTAHAPDSDLYLEAVFLDEDRKTLKGVVRVKNLAFQKWVAVRFTFDWWQTTSEVTATHKESMKGGQYDRFTFSLKLHDMLAKIEDKTLFLALRYTTDGREIWDNNGGSNYQVNFVRTKPAPRGLSAARPSVSAGSGMISAGQGRAIGGRSSQWNVHGQQQDRMADLRLHLNQLTDGELGTSPPEKVAGSVRERAAALTAALGSGPSSPGASSSRRGPPPGLSVPRKADAGPDSPLLSPLGARYDFGAAWLGVKNGNRSSPSNASKDLPEVSSPGLRFNSGATIGPSMEFYSPQLPTVALPCATMSPRSKDRPIVSPPKNKSAKLMGPVVTVEGPSPSPPRPLQAQDYFSAVAPKSPATAVSKPPLPQVTSKTALPSMYSASPVPVDELRSSSSDSLSSMDGGWGLPQRFDSRDRISAEASPPSITSSGTSLSSSPSPMSPPQPNSAAWSPEKGLDVAHIDYSNFLEQ